MPSEVFQLFLLLQLKDFASGGLNNFRANLRATDKDAQKVLRDFDTLRSNLRRDLTIAGVGVGTLALMKKGVDVAADYESAMTDMRMSYQEVGKDGRDTFARLEQQTVALGNRLPGTTQDFVEMYTTLKRGGLDAEAILGGTGEAVANLAIITKQVPKDLAEPFAQYAQQFQLTGDEAKKLADLLGRIEFSTGLKPQELIEGSKFFQLRAGLPLGLTGLSGADVAGRTLAVLRSYGLEGGIGGRELGGFMTSLTFNTKEQQKALAELKKTKGIDFQFFGKKGEFLGMENVFRQMEQFRKLSTQEQLSFGEKLFNREGMAIASVFMKSGVEGWQKINDRINKIAPQQDLINQKTATYNAKLEAVMGTLTNLEATAFTPMLDTLKPTLDMSNEILGSLQGWAKEHADIAKYITTFAGIGGVALTLYGTLRAGQTAWGLWRLASSVALKGTAADAVVAKGAMSGLATPIKISIIAGELIWVVSELKELQRLRAEVSDQQAKLWTGGEANVAEFQKLKTSPGITPQQLAQVSQMQAQTAFAKLNLERTLQEQMEGGAGEWWRAQLNVSSKLSGKSFFERLSEVGAGRYGPVQHPFTVSGDQAALFRQRAPELKAPEVMTAWVQFVHGLKGWSEEAKQNLLGLTKTAYPESFEKSFNLFSQNTIQLSDDAKKTADALQQLGVKVEPLPNQFTNAGIAAQRFADRVNTIDFSRPTFGAPNIVGSTLGLPPGAPVIPSKASGGRVLRGGLVRVHDYEDIVPARVTSRYEDRFSELKSVALRERVETSRVEFRPEVARAIMAESRVRASAPPSKTVHIHGGVHVNVPPGSRAADDPAELARLVAHELAIQIERA